MLWFLAYSVEFLLLFMVIAAPTTAGSGAATLGSMVAVLAGPLFMGAFGAALVIIGRRSARGEDVYLLLNFQAALMAERLDTEAVPPVLFGR